MPKVQRPNLAVVQGGLEKQAAQSMVDQWKSGPIDADRAKSILQQAQTTSYGNDSAKKIVQHFVEHELPKLVKGDDPNKTVDRAWGKDIAAKSWNDNKIDKREAKALVKSWGTKPMARIEAMQLEKEIEKAQPTMDKGAKKVLQKFVDKTLPNEIKDPDIKAQFDKAAADGKITKAEVKAMTEGWKARGQIPLSQVQDIAKNAKDFEPKMDAKALKEMKGFVNKTLPNLIVRQDLANPKTVTLSWDPPTKNTDGSALTDLAGYKLLRGNSPGNYNDVESVTDPTSKTAQMHNLPSGTYYFVAKSVNTAGEESGPSNEASITIP